MSNPISLSIGTSFGDVPLTAVEFSAVLFNADERGTGRPVVILHGGAGPASVSGFADLLADATGTRVIVPTHPGFGGTPRPDALTTVGGLAEVYAGLLDALGLEDAIVIGNSIGGWITAELAVRGSQRLGRFVLVDAVGVEVAGHPVATGLTPAQLTQHAWYDPSKAPQVDPATLPPAVVEVWAATCADQREASNAAAIVSLIFDSRQEQQIIFRPFSEACRRRAGWRSCRHLITEHRRLLGNS